MAGHGGGTRAHAPWIFLAEYPQVSLRVSARGVITNFTNIFHQALYKSLSKAHARVFRHRALPWLLWAEILLARIVHVLHQQTRNGSILDAFIVANWPKITPKLVAKRVKVVPNWLQNRCLASPGVPRSIWGSHSPFACQLWPAFRVPFGCPWETKFASNFNLETIRKECAPWTPKNTLSEAILGLIFNLLQ